MSLCNNDPAERASDGDVKLAGQPEINLRHEKEAGGEGGWRESQENRKLACSLLGHVTYIKKTIFISKF